MKGPGATENNARVDCAIADDGPFCRCIVANNGDATLVSTSDRNHKHIYVQDFGVQRSTILASRPTNAQILVYVCIQLLST